MASATGACEGAGVRGPFHCLRALTRSWQGWLILIVVTTQLLLPLRYYLARRDPHDERFAWRMFSPMRMSRCTPTFMLDDKPLAISQEFHEAWIEIASRGRFVVIEAMAARLCNEHKGSSVKISVDCTYLDSEPRTYGGFNMCSVPLL